MYVEACSSAVLKENPEYVMFMKMKLGETTKGWKCGEGAVRVSPCAGLSVSSSLHVCTGVYCCFRKLLPLLKSQGCTRFRSLSFLEGGQKTFTVKPTGSLKTG